jgi:4-hydroxyacetophenone monooxygenase
MTASHLRLDDDQLLAAIEDADLRVLVMCLFHLTGDERWLAPPFLPGRDVRVIGDPTAGFPPEVQDEIRHETYRILAAGPPMPAVEHPDDTLLHRMMSACLGETVDPEYVPMMREDMGFSSGEAQWRSTPDPARVQAMSVIVIGAGLSGLGLAIQLGRLGLTYTVIEKNLDAGGTWYENRYPGCRVDTPSHFYSYSFRGNHAWSGYFSARDEIEAYLQSCLDEFGVRPNVRFETRVTGAVWSDAEQRWRVTVEGPGGTEQLEASVLVSAIGQLNEPSIPPIPGLETFAGRAFHSARWPSDLDVAGADVAVVGTGASAMQIAPTIAGEVASLTIYQRSPQWARPIPEYGAALRPGTQWLIEHVPFYAAWNRFTLFWRYGDGLLRFLRKDPDWPHPERSLNRMNERHRLEMTDFIGSELSTRPDLVGVCVPDYPPFGKRMLLDNGWFEMLCADNVSLVTDRIDHVVEDGIVTADGTHRRADVVVLATGFVITDMASRLGIVGRNGTTLAAAWSEDNPTAYLGITVPGFPNLFLMYGPNTNLAHGGSIFFHAECQARYITKALVAMVEDGIRSVDCRPDVCADYVARVDAEHEGLVWTHPGMTTWYRNRHGRVISVSPWRLVDYWDMTRQPDLSDYQVRRA